MEGKITSTAARFIRVLLVLLGLLSLVVEAVFMPLFGREIMREFPEAEPFVLLGLIWSILTIGCGQAILVIAWKLVSLVVHERVFSAVALPWVRASITMSVGALGLFVAAFIAANILNFTPPSVMYGLIGAVLLCLTFTLVTKTLLGLSRRTTQLYDETAEVA